MSLPRYPQYKDSGVTWIGLMPAHWRVQPLLSIAPERYDSNVGMLEDNLLSLSYGRIVRKDIESNDGLLPESFETYQIVRPNDIVFRLTDLQNDKRSLRTAIVEEQGIITSAYVAAKPSGINARYLNYLLRAYDVTKVFYSMGGGLRQSMKFSDIKRLPVLVPEVAEQIAIATFLDRETGKIDALIAEQEKLLALLAEKRQATISHAVTKGLNLDAPMKNSGVAWLGEVPEHWGIGPIKRWYATSSGGTPDTAHQDEYYIEEGGYPWIRTTDLNNDRLDNYEIAITDEAIRNSACSMLPVNSVLVAMYGGDGTIGKNALLTIEACINQAVCALLPNEDFDSRYTFRYVQFYRPYWMVGAESSRKDPNISQALIRNVSILCPPISEQIAIAEFLDTETTKLDALKAESECAISLLTERRSALIAAAVTGQIDVRGLVTQPEAA